MATLANVAAVGIRQDLPEYLRSKIQITNFVSIAFFFLCFPFTWFTNAFFSDIVIFPILFQIASLLILVANFFQAYSLSRFIACLVYISL